MAIVGGRNADSFGRELSYRYAESLSAAGAVVISGLALGVDTAAHQGALSNDCQAKTIAVLGNALPDIYPKSNHRLVEKIKSQQGLVVSQFMPGEKTYPSNFLNRNRIIAALADVVIVIQAGARSGSLSTARSALEYGKDLYVIPGAVDDPRYTGSNKLIQQGANVLLSEEDLKSLSTDLSYLARVEDDPSCLAIDPELQNVISLIASSPGIDFDQLKNKIQSIDITLGIEKLKSMNLVKELPGRIYRIHKPNSGS